MSRPSDVDTSVFIEEAPVELSLRPKRLSEFIGQEAVKSNLLVFLKAAQQRCEPLDHLLLYGPPGLGKTTLAHIVSQEMSAQIHVTSGPALQIPGDLVGILTNLEAGSILFIDEIHRIPRAVEEMLYPAMEDRKVDLMIGKGPAARSVRLEVNPFTVIGATTRQGLLTGPLRDRFGIVMNFGFYSKESLFEIIVRSADILGFPISKSGAEEIAKRSRGTPRIANRLLKRIRDFAQVDQKNEIDSGIADRALTALDIDSNGLDRIDRQLLQTIAKKFGGGPVGLETLAASIGEDGGTVEDVYEPFLMQQGFLARTPRGRILSPAGYAILGLEPTQNQDPGLFS